MTLLRKKVQDFYNDYHSNRLRSPEESQLKKYWSFFHRSVLEVGAGRWLWSDSNQFPYLIAEISEVALKHAIQAGVSGVLADGTELPFSNGAFATVACHDVLEHVVAPDIFICEMCRVSERYVLIAGPNYVGGKIPGEPGANLISNLWSFSHGEGKGYMQIENPHLTFDAAWQPDADALNAINVYWVAKILKTQGFRIIHLETWGKAARGFDRLPVIKYLGPFMILAGEKYEP